MSQFGIKTDAQIEKDEKFVASVLKVQRSFQGVKDTVGQELYPALEKMFNQFEKFAESKEGRQFFEHDLPNALELMLKLVSAISRLSAGGIGNNMAAVRYFQGKSGAGLPAPDQGANYPGKSIDKLVDDKLLQFYGSFLSGGAKVAPNPGRFQQNNTFVIQGGNVKEIEQTVKKQWDKLIHVTNSEAVPKATR